MREEEFISVILADIYCFESRLFPISLIKNGNTRVRYRKWGKERTSQGERKALLPPNQQLCLRVCCTRRRQDRPKQNKLVTV
jgi:hypothetical protein